MSWKKPNVRTREQVGSQQPCWSRLDQQNADGLGSSDTYRRERGEYLKRIMIRRTVVSEWPDEDSATALEATSKSLLVVPTRTRRKLKSRTNAARRERQPLSVSNRKRCGARKVS